MNIYVLTLFPQMVEQGLGTSILGRAQKNGLLNIKAIDIREYSADKHKKVDDYPYGGGAGMLMQAQPVYDAYMDLVSAIGKRPRTVYVTPWGRTFDQPMANELATEEDLIFICGHYEGVDERVLELTATDYVSIGDYVLTGGELPAMVMIDCISRLVPGVLGNDTSAGTESFADGLLEYPQYTRPEEFEGLAVPEVLLSGHHENVDKWRRRQSVIRTAKYRPDLIAAADLTCEERRLAAEYITDPKDLPL